MKTFIIFLIIFISLTFCIHCDNDEKITAFYEDDKEVKEGDLVPFLLYQNYPNPFNPTTTIRFDLASQRKVKIKVYSEDWQVVGTLINDMSSVGSHSVQFNAVDLPSGEYYYTMESGDYIQFRKMKLVK
ncbi:MAG: T9SS type A sorting domain-containing protein [Calditrichaceae bacterium]|nr:T9SS type A sorting domain-containing protein [Calditrichaceae bacterium]